MIPSRLPRLLSVAGILSVAAATPLMGAGELDPSFNGTGFASVAPSPNGRNAGAGVVIQGNGKIVVGGTVTNSQGYEVFSAARFNTDGSLDSSFGSGGKVIKQFTGQGDRVNCMAMYSNGNFILAGEANHDFAIVGYTLNGQETISFKTSFAFGDGHDAIYDIALLDGGKILVLGDIGRSTDLGLARFTTTGQLDTTFGENGRIASNLAPVYMNSSRIRVLPDGKILVAAQISDGSPFWDFALTRRNADGSPDSSFAPGSDGVARASRPGTISVASLDLLPDGKILIGGTFNSNFAMLRFLADGSLDTSFGDEGMTAPDFGTRDFMTDLVVQEDGKLVAVGYSLAPSRDSDHLMARYLPDGSLDTSFGNSGVVRRAVPGATNEFSQAVAKQSDGKLVVAGSTGSYSKTEFSVMRYVADGNTTFADWATAGGLSGTSAGPDASPKQDGVPNLLKYAFNLNGLLADRRILEAGTGTAGLPRFESFPVTSPRSLRVEYIRRKSSGLNYLPKVSTDLAHSTFVPMNGIPQVTPIDAQWERVAMEHVFQGTPPRQAFGVVEVTPE